MTPTDLEALRERDGIVPLIDLIHRALKFTDWAAGEGVCPLNEDGSVGDSPEDILFDFTNRTEDDDWPGIPERVSALLSALIAQQVEG